MIISTAGLLCAILSGAGAMKDDLPAGAGLQASTSPAAVGAGERFEIVFSLHVPDGWVVYAPDQPPGVGLASRFNVDQIPGFTVEGELRAPAAKERPEPFFGGRNVRYFDRSVVLRRSLRTAPGALGADYPLRGNASLTLGEEATGRIVFASKVPFQSSIRVLSTRPPLKAERFFGGEAEPEKGTATEIDFPTVEPQMAAVTKERQPVTIELSQDSAKAPDLSQQPETVDPDDGRKATAAFILGILAAVAALVVGPGSDQNTRVRYRRITAWSRRRLFGVGAQSLLAAATTLVAPEWSTWGCLSVGAIVVAVLCRFLRTQTVRRLGNAAGPWTFLFAGTGLAIRLHAVGWAVGVGFAGVFVLRGLLAPGESEHAAPLSRAA